MSDPERELDTQQDDGSVQDRHEDGPDTHSRDTTSRVPQDENDTDQPADTPDQISSLSAEETTVSSFSAGEGAPSEPLPAVSAQEEPTRTLRSPEERFFSGERESWKALEERVRRLEDVVASWQPGQQSRILTNTMADAGEDSPSSANDSPTETSQYLLDTQHLLPVRRDSSFLPAADQVVHRLTPGQQPRPRLLFDLYAEFRSMVRMYVDPRYKLRWITRLVPPLLIVAMVLSWWVVSPLPLVGVILDRCLVVLLAYVLFKVLGREAIRYRETSPDVPPTLRM